MPREVSYVILGADDMGRQLGAALRQSGEEIVFIDNDADFVRAAEEEGFHVVFGDGLDSRAMVKARVETRRACIGATHNESTNFLFAKKVRESAKRVATYVAIDRREDGVSMSMVKQNRSNVLLAGARELAAWRATAARKRVVTERWRALADAPDGNASFAERRDAALLPMTLVRRDTPVAPIERDYCARSIGN